MCKPLIDMRWDCESYVCQGVSPRDNGGWTCRVTATVAGKTQVSADIVRLFVGKLKFYFSWVRQMYLYLVDN